MSSKYAGIKLTNGAATTVALVRLGFLMVWWEPDAQRVRIARRGTQPDWFKEGIGSQDAALAYCDSVAAFHAN